MLDKKQGSPLSVLYNTHQGELGDYRFQTGSGIEYSCVFGVSNDRSIYGISLPVDVFHFAFFRVDEDTSPQPIDSRIQQTVVHLINLFFERNENAVLSYVCDGTDDNEMKRLRLFERWFIKNNNSPIKVLLKIEVAPNILGGVILVKDNSFEEEITSKIERDINEFREYGKNITIQRIE
jgi:hypothetical protein